MEALASGLRARHRRSTTESLELLLDVEGADHAPMLVLAPRLARNAPHHLELVAVGITAVERLRDAVVARSAERAGGRKDVPCLRQVRDRRDLPREVVQPNRAARRVLCLRPDREE